MNKEPTPPKWAIRFFQWYCNDHLAEAVLQPYSVQMPAMQKLT